jgi:hypothetical protein
MLLIPKSPDDDSSSFQVHSRLLYHIGLGEIKCIPHGQAWLLGDAQGRPRCHAPNRQTVDKRRHLLAERGEPSASANVASANAEGDGYFASFFVSTSRPMFSKAASLFGGPISWMLVTGNLSSKSGIGTANAGTPAKFTAAVFWIPRNCASKIPVKNKFRFGGAFLRTGSAMASTS